MGTIQRLGGKAVKIHVCMGDESLVIFIPQTDIIQLYILDRYDTPHGVALFLFIRPESVNEELVIPFFRTWSFGTWYFYLMHIRQYVIQSHVAEFNLSVAEGKRRELGECFSYIRQRIALTVFQIYIFYRESGGELITHRPYLRVRAESTRQLGGRQPYGSRLHFVARQSSYECSAYQCQTGKHDP